MNSQEHHTIPPTYTQVLERIAAAAHRANRDPATIRLIAVGKTRPPAALAVLHAAGQRDFGENYPQEFETKAIEARSWAPPPVWHFIGQIQGNKTRVIARHADVVHSVDRLRIAERLGNQRLVGAPDLKILLQVDLSGETGKGGVALDALDALADAVAGVPRLRLRGLMAVPAPTPDHDQQRRAFAQLRRLRDNLEAHGHRLPWLSMGMSADLEAAILEGATHVRIGTALFGPRQPPGTVDRDPATIAAPNHPGEPHRE